LQSSLSSCGVSSSTQQLAGSQAVQLHIIVSVMLFPGFAAPLKGVMRTAPLGGTG